MPHLRICRPRHQSLPTAHPHIRFAKGTKAAANIVPSPTTSSSFNFQTDAHMPSPLPTTHSSRQMRGLCHTRIHHLLAVCDSRHGPMINFDMTLPPSSVLLPHQRGEPATHPPQRTLTIVCPFLPWPITIQKTHYVSVWDVLEHIYSELRRSVSAEEYAYLPPQAQSRASEAYRTRYRRMVDKEQYYSEKRKGMRRADFLLEHRYWMGLSSTMNGPTVWELRVTGS